MLLFVRESLIFRVPTGQKRVKDDGTRKARCVCNGAPNMAGSVTLAQTYSAALDQTGARLFWAKAALDNFIILGADASNAFAEAPAPVAPLCL